MKKNRNKMYLPGPVFLILLGFVLILSFHFRTKKILYSPGWLRDEGTYLEVARRIGKGQLQMGAVNITFVGPNMTHPPLYFTLANIFLKIKQADMYSFRQFNAFLGVLATLLLFFLGYEAGRYRKPEDPPTLYAELLGLLSAFIFAIHPDAVLYNRMGLPYNLYMVEVIIFAWFMLKYIRSREFIWCLGACIIASIALLSVYYSVVFIPFLFIIILLMKKPKHFWALVCVPVPLIFFLSFLASGHIPGFWDDITALQRASGAGSLYVTLYHYHDFFQTGISYFIGMLGLVLLKRKSAGWSLFFLFFLIIHIVLRREDTIIKFVHYPVIPILPLVAVGCAALTLRAWYGLADLSPVSLLIIPILFAFWFSISQVKHGIYGRFYTPLSELGMNKNCIDAFKTADFLNDYVKSDDLVIATTTMWPLINSRAADLPQSLAFEGERVDFYNHHFSRERFLFSPSLKKTDFVVLDYFTDQWRKSPPDSYHGPLVRAIKMIEEHWKLVFTQGEYRVYKNPWLSESENNVKSGDTVLEKK
jgi:hypothetical protein